MITGATSADDGQFSIDINNAYINVEIRFIGFRTIEITDVTFKGQTADLGMISLEADSKALEEVLITAEKSTTEFKLDKRVFNVGKDLSTTGAGALFNEQAFDFSADQWSGKLTAKYKLSKAVDIEFTGRHQSKEQTVQGLVSPYSSLDGGMRIKILNGKGIFSLSARDIFASRVREVTVDQAEYSLFSSGMRGRFLTAGFSYGFGKGEAMQFSGAKRR